MKEERKEPIIEAVEGDPKIEAVEEPEAETDRKPESEAEGDEESGIEDRLELDRMEVKPAPEPEEAPEEAVEPEVAEPEEEGPARPDLLAMLAAYWVWILAVLVGLSVVSAVLLFLMTPGEERKEVKLGKRVHVITASLGGEHYVRFNLYGPFRDPRGQAALERGMPRIRHDLIVSGGDPQVVVSIEEKDLYFLEGHILEIVSNATGIPVEELDLKGLSLTRYSDEAEVEGEG